MPGISPLFPKPQIYMRGAEIITINFETDMESALNVLPAPLTLREPATASLGVAYIPKSSMGMYYEAMLILPCWFEGQPHRYDVLFMVTNDAAFALGRETHGASKKLGHVMLEHRPEAVIGYAERPRGHRVLQLGVTLEEELKPNPADLNVVPSVSLRIVGQPNGYKDEVTAELIQTPASWNLLEMWSGKGSVSFPEANAIDKWSILPVNKITGAFYSKVNIDIPVPNLLATL